jgi:hypothetical protein
MIPADELNRCAVRVLGDEKVDESARAPVAASQALRVVRGGVAQGSQRSSHTP